MIRGVEARVGWRFYSPEEARIVKNTLNKTAQVFVKAQRTKSIMIGYSGSYGINGKQICLYSPPQGQWNEKKCW